MTHWLTFISEHHHHHHHHQWLLGFLPMSSFIHLPHCFPVTSSPLSPDIFLRSLFSDTLNRLNRDMLYIFHSIIFVTENHCFRSWHCFQHQLNMWNLLCWLHWMELICPQKLELLVPLAPVMEAEVVFWSSCSSVETGRWKHTFVTNF